MSTDFHSALEGALASLFEGKIALKRANLIPGGASKEAWSVDLETAAGPLALLVRRAGGGVIYSETLSLEHEHAVVKTAHENGVLAPKTYGYLPDVAGRPAFVMERVSGEGIGRKVVSRPDLAAARAALPSQMAHQLARIHAIDPAALPFLPGGGNAPAHERVIERLYREIDAAAEPHPAIEYGLRWMRDNPPSLFGETVIHGDYRIGNLLVGDLGLTAVLDWEFCHVGDPIEDLAWPLVRAWRFGQDKLHLGGIAPSDEYIHVYTRETGRKVDPKTLFFWELAGNVKWAIGCVTQARRHLSGKERSVELASLGRLAAEVEYEIVDLVERAPK
ncbi:MAG: phosphotransferase family protein [Polyangiaceae bacterium]|nr:phosphotransferase family protein [Polyangiaceae bacterium]